MQTSTVVDEKQTNTVTKILRREVTSAVESIDEFFGSLDQHSHYIECVLKAWTTVRTHAIETMNAMTKDAGEITRIALAPLNGNFFSIAMKHAEGSSVETETKLDELTKATAVVAAGGKKRLGRPKGSKNKPKDGSNTPASSGTTEAPKKRLGRPKGSKNKPKDGSVTPPSPGKPGRPKGSKNKPKEEGKRAPRVTTEQASAHATVAYLCPCGKTSNGNGFFKHGSSCKLYQALIKEKGVDEAKKTVAAKAVKAAAKKLRATG
jgi:hypothetical protein